MQDSLWLCLAIVLHALLFLAPVLQKDRTNTETVPLSITLLAPPPVENTIRRGTRVQKDRIAGSRNENRST